MFYPLDDKYIYQLCVRFKALAFTGPGAEEVFRLDFTSHLQENQTENHLIDDADFSSHPKPAEAGSLLILSPFEILKILV